MSAEKSFPISTLKSHLHAEAEFFDAVDPLSFMREEYFLPEGIYLDGNSLGAMSRQEEFRLDEYKEARRKLGVRAWTEGSNPWFWLNNTLRQKMAPLIGAKPGEISIMPTVSNAITQAVSVLYDPDGERKGVLVDSNVFPTDGRAIAAYMRDHKLNPNDHIHTVPAQGEITEEKDIVATMEQLKDQVSLVVWPTVDYKTGQLYDTALITREAHDRGIKVLFDASHSFAMVPHHANDEDADGYVWTDYKWANGSPGTVGGMYLNSRYQIEEGVLSGWWAAEEDDQFDMDWLSPLANDARRFESGTLSVPALVSLLGALETLETTTVAMRREKSLKQTGHLIKLVDTLLPERGFYIATPRDPRRRGGHIALAHENPAVAAQINEALKRDGVTPDFRPPRFIRLAPACYNTFQELVDTILIARDVYDSGEYLQFPGTRRIVA